MSLLQTERNLNYVFQVLARCPKTSDEAARQRVADTMIYQHGSLRVWYFTDPDSGEVLRRDRREWSADRILDIFCTDGHRVAPHGVPVAFYVHYAAGRSGATGGGGSDGGGRHAAERLSGVERVIDLATKYCRQYGDDAEPLSVDYFDSDTLRAFLATRENKHNVILQKMVRGRADHASMLQVVWSPHRVLATQRQNKHSVYDLRVPLYQRTNTFDNTTHLSNEMRPTSVMSSRLDVECRRIVEHIVAVEQRIVTRMVAFFAFDGHQNPVLLFASEIQITSQPATAEHVRLGLSMQLKRKLCMVSPQIIPSDVVFPNYAKVSGSSGGGGHGQVKKPSAGVSGGIGGARLSLKESSSSHTNISAQLHASGADTFDDEMDLLDATFASAYEARNDRGKLSDDQRKVFVGPSAFEVGTVDAASWRDFQHTQHQKQRSYLQVGKRFYTPDPLKQTLQRPQSSMAQGGPHADDEGDLHPYRLPPSLVDNDKSRPASSLGGTHGGCKRPMSAQSLGSAHRTTTSASKVPFRTAKTGTSLLLNSQVKFSKGGGGGLYLRHRPLHQAGSGGGTSSHDDGASQTEKWTTFAGSESSFNNFEGALAQFRSPPHSPLRSSPSTLRSSFVVVGGGAPEVEPLHLIPSVASMAKMNPRHWQDWRRVLKQCAQYRSMVTHTQTKHHCLATGASDTPPSMESDAVVARAAQLRLNPSDWVEVELLVPTNCTSEQLRHVDCTASSTTHNTRGAPGPRRYNLWHLLHPLIAKDWMLWSATMHRGALDGIETLMAELDRMFHSISAVAGGAPWCDLTVRLEADLTEVPHGTLLRLMDASHTRPAPRHADDPPPHAMLPWMVAPWVVAALTAPSLVFAPPGPPQAASDDNTGAPDNTAPTSTLCSRFIEKMCSMDDGPCGGKPSSSAMQVRRYNVPACARALEAVLLPTTAKRHHGQQQQQKGGAVNGHALGWHILCAPSTDANITDSERPMRVAIDLPLARVTQDHLLRIQAALRGLLSSVLSSWQYHILCNLKAVQGFVDDAVVERRGLGISKPSSGTSKSAQRRQLPTGPAEVVVPPELVCAEQFVDLSANGASAAECTRALTVTEEEWSVVTKTVAQAVDDCERAIVASSFEWPPRLTFVK